MGGVVDTITGRSAKKAEKQAKKAAAAQQKLLDEKEKKLAEEEAARMERIGRSRQGRRSLLYSEGTEAGTKATTLGGQ